MLIFVQSPLHPHSNEDSSKSSREFFSSQLAQFVSVKNIRIELVYRQDEYILHVINRVTLVYRGWRVVIVEWKLRKLVGQRLLEREDLVMKVTPSQ